MRRHVLDHVAGLEVGAAVLGTLKRADGSRVGRVGVGAGGGEDARGERGVVAAAVLSVQDEHDVEQHGLLVREALVAAQDVEHGLRHRVSLAHRRHHELGVVELGHVGCVRHGGRARPAAEQRQRDVNLMCRRDVVGRGVEGVEQQRGALQDVHDGVAVRRTREDAQVALGQLLARVDAGAEVVELLARGEAPGYEQVGDLLVAKAILGLRAVDELVDVISAIDQATVVGLDAVIGPVVAVHVGDRREAHEHAGAVRVAQTALDVVLLVQLLRHHVHVLVAAVEAVGDRRLPQGHRGHGIGVGHVVEGRRVARREDGPAGPLGKANHGLPPCDKVRGRFRRPRPRSLCPRGGTCT